MAIESKDDNVFRFVHLRGRRLRPDGEPGPDDDETGEVELRRGEPVRGRASVPAVGPGRPGAARPEVGRTEAARSEAGRTDDGDLAATPGELLRIVVAAKQELEGLAPGRDLTVPTGDDGAAESGLLAVTESGRRRLSTATAALLERLDVPIVGSPITTLIGALDQLILSSRARVRRVGSRSPVAREVPRVKAVGVAELLVVKQQITRYEPAEIAHIENVLSGEGKVRTHRKLDRTEEEVETFNEETHSLERELESTERFELNKETTTTTQTDHQKGFGLSLSGRYGPSVEFSSELNIQTNTSRTESTRNAVNYAKDVIERSRDSIVTTVREQRRRRMLREIEEVNEHSLINSSGAHISGVYQFLDKIYTSRVFNYGLRQMFDFLIPEPASYLVHLNNAPRSDIELPVPPVELSAFLADASDVDEANYLELGALYHVEGLVPPPPVAVIRRQGVTHGQGEATEEGKPRSFSEMEIDIPPGYLAVSAEVSAVLTSDEIPNLVISLGTRMLVVSRSDMTQIDLSQGNFKAYTYSTLVPLSSEGSDHLAAEKIAVHVFANETANYTVKVKIYFWKTDASLAWQIKTYELISKAYQNLALQYHQAVEEIRARREQELVGTDDFGSPPARNLRIIAAELKKHCLAILRGTHDNSLSTVHSGGTTPDDPPLFDIADALQDGARIRFLETAFEWDQMQYAFYPYFWARSGQWAERFHLRNLDPVFEEFLRAGSARVVLPVRPGLEAAVSYFLETGKVWGGRGEPTVNDPLYKPIVEEIKERSGAGQGEIPVGDPWETRVPTAAVKLRKDDGLPEWELQPGSDWHWVPKV